jgi:ankyrin repeat protein
VAAEFSQCGSSTSCPANVISLGAKRPEQSWAHAGGIRIFLSPQLNLAMNKIQKFVSSALASLLVFVASSAFSEPSLQDQLIEEISDYSWRNNPAASLIKIKTFLQKGARIDVKASGWDPLAAAIYAGRPDVVDLIIEKKHDVRKPVYSDDVTPLMLAMQLNTSDGAKREVRHKIVASLLAAGADPNVMITPINSALSDAASYAGNIDLELMKILLKNGAKPDFDVHHGRTALFGASGNLDAVKLLLNAGANPFTVSSYGGTPLHTVCNGSGKAGQPDPQAAERIKLLKNPKLDINAYAKNSNLEVPLASNIVYGNLDCIQALIDAGASVDVIYVDPALEENKERLTVLQAAKKYYMGNKAMIGVLQKNSKAKK